MIQSQTQSQSQKGWSEKQADVFWAEVAPLEHVLQLFESENNVLNALEGFADSGFNDGESVVFIATQSRIEALNARLIDAGYDVHLLKLTGMYIPLIAEDTLSEFMKDGWPDEVLFNAVVDRLIKKARGHKGRKVRAYGEMVAVLWNQGHSGATVCLEHLWNKFIENEPLKLFCAYPKAGFTRNLEHSVEHICQLHTKIIDGNLQSKSQVVYQLL